MILHISIDSGIIYRFLFIYFLARFIFAITDKCFFCRPRKRITANSRESPLPKAVLLMVAIYASATAIDEFREGEEPLASGSSSLATFTRNREL